MWILLRGDPAYIVHMMEIEFVHNVLGVYQEDSKTYNQSTSESGMVSRGRFFINRSCC